MPESTIENGSTADMLARICDRLTTEQLRILRDCAREMRDEDSK